MVGCAALRKFDEMMELMNQPVIDKADWNRMCAVPLTSYCQMSQGLGYSLQSGSTSEEVHLQ